MADARFHTDLVVKKIGERTWLLMEDLIFYSARFRGFVVAPRGFQTNLASIPTWAGSIFPLVGHQDKAAVIHDAGYGNALLTLDRERIFTIKHVADQLFDEGMEAEGVNTIKRWFMYRAVVLAGDPDGHPLAAHRRPDAMRLFKSLRGRTVGPVFVGVLPPAPTENRL